MSLTIKVAIAALLCPFASAAICAQGSCVEDETALMQMKTVMKHGTERRDPVDDKAEIDSMPDNLDDGSVTSAYHANSDKVAGPIESQEADDLEFGDKVDKERADISATAQAAIDSQNQELQDVIDKASSEVQEVADDTQAVMDAADDTVDGAREDYEAHAIKKSQAEDAAVIGSLAGQDKGYTAASNMQEDHDEAQADDAESQDIADEQAALDDDARSTKDAIDEDTLDKQKAYEAAVQDNGRAVEAAKKQVQSDAAVAKTSIEGPEGLYNQVTSDDADADANAYGREATKAQNSIKKYSDAA